MNKIDIENLCLGTEMDILVAVAAGMEIDTLLGTGRKFVREVERDWSPSSNLSDAFEIAKRVHLFEHRALLFDDGIWFINEAAEVFGRFYYGDSLPHKADGYGMYVCGSGIVARGFSPEVAICRAILKVENESQE